jgi:hypothetical protein
MVIRKSQNVVTHYQYMSDKYSQTIELIGILTRFPAMMAAMPERNNEKA